jgi:hypothetical protein
MLLRTSRLTGAEVDAQARRARVAPGALWRDVVEPASEHGLAALAGSSPEVGIVGYTLGGGMGWLARRHGLAANSVTAAEIVTADGRLLRIDRENEPELFWAIRGGGGNFGVVTSLEFELYELPQVFAGMLLWPWERTAEVLHRWREWEATVPDEVTSDGRVIQFPPIPDVPEPLRGRPFVGVEVAYLGGDAEGAELIAPLRELDAEMDTFAMVPPTALSVLHMDPEDPVPGLSSHRLLGDLGEEGFDALVNVAGPESGSPLLSVELRQLGGALAEAAPGAGATASVPGRFAMFAVGLPMDEASGKAIHEHCGVVSEALAPWDQGSVYLNFTEHPVDTADGFPAETYERLRRVKEQYDPDDLFRGHHPVTPAGAG